MSKNYQLLAICAGVTALWSVASAQLAESDWPKHFRDLRNTSRSPAHAPQAPTLRWSSSVPTFYIMAAPTVVGHTVNVPTAESTEDGHARTFQFDSILGSVNWQFVNPSSGLGNKGTAAIAASGKTYFGGDDGFIYSVQSNGTPLWAVAIGGGASVHSPVVLPSGEVLAAQTSHFGASGALKLLSEDGVQIWQKPLTKYVSLSPAVAQDGTIYVAEGSGWGGSGALIALDPNGTELWRYSGAPALTQSPVIRPDGSILIGLQSGRLACVSPSGTQLWQSPVIGNVNEGVFGPSFLSDGRIVVGTGSGTLRLISSDGQTVLWTRNVGTPVGGNTGPCVDATDRILYGTSQGVYCFSPDGTQEWLFPTTSPVSGGPVMDDSGAVYFATFSSTVYCLNPDIVNHAPIANAGPDQQVSSQGPGGTEIHLDGSGSSDPDNDPLTYTWTGPFFEGGGTVTGASPTVTLPVGVHTITLTVSDGMAEASNTVQITVLNDAPIANAGPDQVTNTTSAAGASVQLDGTGSSDPNGDPLAYTWTGPFPEGGGTVSGAMPVVTLPAGVHVITLTVCDGFTTSVDTVQIVVRRLVDGLGDAGMWIGLKNSDDIGTKFDLRAEVRLNGTLVGEGLLNDVPGGSSGFNNAVKRLIPMNVVGVNEVHSGDTLSFTLYARIAASSGHRSGTVRLWYNDSAANSSFDATIGGESSTYFLRVGSELAGAAGPGPKKTVDVFCNRAVGGNPFISFGTWSVTIP